MIKKMTLVTLFLTALSQVSHSQTNTFPSSGSAGVGLTNPQSMLHLYGTGTFSEQGFFVFGQGYQPGQNYGVTSRMQWTNSTTGSGQYDGFAIRQSELNTALTNREGKDITIKSSGAFQCFEGNYDRISYGEKINTASTGNAYVNIIADGDNGLYIKAKDDGDYGAKINVFNENVNAIEVVNATDETENHFTVTGGGEVFARKISVTLDSIPDYVFDEEYKLMTIDSLANFVEEKNHLPNVPSAEDYAENGVDIGEMNRILLEKVEELSLYIIELNSRIKKLENLETRKETNTISSKN